jgi:hypothetical protein
MVYESVELQEPSEFSASTVKTVVPPIAGIATLTAALLVATTSLVFTPHETVFVVVPLL